MEPKIVTAWCPGCGNFAIRDVLEKVLRELPVPKNKIVLTSGIGQAAKMPHYLDVNYFNGLHGRSLPLAVGIKLARPDLTVIAYSGDGCMYGEGGNHFIQTLRRRLDITILVSENQVYGLTKGQSSTSRLFFLPRCREESPPCTRKAYCPHLGAPCRFPYWSRWGHRKLSTRSD